MSREDWEVFVAIKEERKKKRAERQKSADSARESIANYIRESGGRLQSPTPNHWVVRDEAGVAVCAYWPSTMRMQLLPHGKVMTGVQLDAFARKAREILQE